MIRMCPLQTIKQSRAFIIAFYSYISLSYISVRILYFTK